MSDESNIGGMTVNERLHHFGLLGEFDAAIRARNKATAIKVLTQARFSPEQAEYTVSQVLSARKVRVLGNVRAKAARLGQRNDA